MVVASTLKQQLEKKKKEGKKSLDSFFLFIMLCLELYLYVTTKHFWNEKKMMNPILY